LHYTGPFPGREAPKITSFIEQIDLGLLQNRKLAIPPGMNTLICLLTVTLANQPATLLQCPELVANKGEVKCGPALAHAFELTNRGAGTLTITKVEASCGCLRQSLTSGVLLPGETAKLTIEVNTLTQPAGQNRWQITAGYKVESPNAPAQLGEILLQITANLTREIIVTPPQLGFSTTTGASQTLTITDKRLKPLKVLKAATSSPYLLAEVGPRVDAADGAHNQSVSVKLLEQAPTGHRDETVILTTDDPDYPELRVPVRVLKRVAGSVIAAPETVSIRFGSDQAEISTPVQLRSADGKPFGIASADSDHPGVTVKWSMGTGAVGVVRITIAESAAIQSGSCKVRVKLGDAAGEEIVIPVSSTGVKKER
jgi:hypothetical protein